MSMSICASADSIEKLHNFTTTKCHSSIVMFPFEYFDILLALGKLQPAHYAFPIYAVE